MTGVQTCALPIFYNYDRELRPKLFKRMRPFVWTEAIHETVRLSPVVYDSDIEITHLPEKSHTDRDLGSFHALTQKKEPLSERLFTIYAKELLISGRDADLLLAEDFFTGQADGDLPMERMKEALCVVVRAARIRGDYLKMYRYAMKDIASEGVSEVCFELGEYYFGTAIYEEAAMWFYNAAYETESILSIRCSGDLALGRLADCYEKMGLEGQARDYRKKAMDWKADGSFGE